MTENYPPGREESYLPGPAEDYPSETAESYPPAQSSLLPGEPLAPLPAEPPEDEPGTTDVVKDQAADLKQSGVEAGQHAAGVAQEQASQVASEAAQQAKGLLDQAQQQVGDQVTQGQQRLATELLSIGDDLSSMADGSQQQGTAASLARQAASRVRGVGQWLDERSPAQVVDDVQAFARRRPGLFLAAAVGVGVAAGRLTRGLQSAQSDDDSAASTTQTVEPADTPDVWAASAEDPLADPAVSAGYPAPADPLAPGAVPGSQLPPDFPEADDADIVVADDGSAVPVVDGLPATGAGTSSGVYPQADELGTLGRDDFGGGSE